MSSVIGDSLAGRRALVTGGTRGIGAATARTLADAGAHVVVSARSAPPSARFPVIEADLADAAQVQRLGELALEQLGGIDILVSNVGGQVRRPGALDFTEADWQAELSVNLLSAVRLDRVLVPTMVEQGGGAVVHVSSGAARLARPQSLPYSATKAALNVYSKGLANEVGPHGVRVNVVAPGFIRTSRIDELAAERNSDSDTVADEIATSLNIPLQRAGSAEEAAQLILFLVSPGSSYITGAQFDVDGGAAPTT